MERELPRNRTSGYEYGRETDRVRTPFYNREQELRDRDFTRYRDTELDPYISRHSPPGHSTYKDNYKRLNDYYYNSATYSAARRSVSPRPRYSTRRSLSPGVRQPIAPYERRYDRDRPPRFDAAHRPRSRHWGVNNEKERDIKRIHNNPNDVYSDSYDRYRRERRKPWDVVEKSREDEDEQNESSITTATATNVQERARDRERDERQRSWDVKEEKTRDVKSERNNGGTITKDTYERQIPRERSTKYWDMNEDKSRELERNSNKNRDRDNRGNQERGEFEQAFPSLNDDHPSTPALDFFPPITMPTDSFALQSSPSI
ncbi:918_t:CDS:2, partial [Cetraspora pellucida]